MGASENALVVQEAIGERPERLTYSVDVASKVLGIGRNTAYEMVRAGHLPSLRLGKRIVIPKAALDQLLANPGAHSAGR